MTCNLYFKRDSFEMLPIPLHFFTSIFYTPLVLDSHASTVASILSFYKDLIRILG